MFGIIQFWSKGNDRYQMPMFSREYLKQVMKLSVHDVTIFMTFTGRLPLLRDCNGKFNYEPMS